MAKRDIMVIGASTGGVEAMKEISAGLPPNFPASVFLVQHISPQSPAVMHQILSRAGVLPAVNPRDQERIQPGRIYVAPPDHHLLLEPEGLVRLTRGPKENRFRPAVDPLFRSAALAFGPRVVGVILTGGLDDGTAGLWAVKRCGGVAVVQDPVDALLPAMPLNAMRHVKVDYSLPLKAIAPLLIRLSGEEVEEGAFSMPEDLDIEVKIASGDNALEDGVMKLGDFSPFTCPECHGALLQLREGNLLRYRCHTGHAFSANSLLASLMENIEDSLWTAIRSIQESAMLMRHIAEHLGEHKEQQMAELFLQKAWEAQQRSDFVRQAVVNHEKPSRDNLLESVEEGQLLADDKQIRDSPGKIS